MITHYSKYLKVLLIGYLNNLLIKFRIFKSERFARYIFSSSHIKQTSIRPKYAAFLPNYNEKSKKFETSVFRINSLTESAIWEIGDYVENSRNKKAANKISMKGYARFLYKNVIKYQLYITQETSSHPLHANILGWPTEREAQKELAILLAKTAILKMKKTQI